MLSAGQVGVSLQPAGPSGCRRQAGARPAALTVAAGAAGSAGGGGGTRQALKASCVQSPSHSVAHTVPFGWSWMNW